MTFWIDEIANEHDERSKALVELLTLVLSTQANIQAALETTPGVDLGDVPWPAVEFRARRFWTRYVLDLRGKPALRNLVETMADRFPPKRQAFVGFLELRAGRTAGWYVVDDPLDAIFVGPGLSHPMLDRKPLREQLRLLHKHGYRTLNITGGSASGKTFSLQLLQMLAEREGLSVLHVDVADWGTERFTAVSLVEAFAAQLRVTVNPQVIGGVPDPHTRARLLLYELREAFPKGSDVRWVVVDGLDRANVDPDARALVERLLKSIDVDGKPGNVRFVVTGFDGLLPLDTRRDPIGGIVRGDVRELFELTAKQLGRAATKKKLDHWTDEVMRGYDPSRQDLGELGAQIYKTVRDELAVASEGTT